MPAGSGGRPVGAGETFGPAGDVLVGTGKGRVQVQGAVRMVETLLGVGVLLVTLLALRGLPKFVRRQLRRGGWL